MCLQIAGLAARTAIIDAIFAQAYFIKALAQPAIFVAGAAPFWLVADSADKFFGHGVRLARIRSQDNGTIVGEPAVIRSAPHARSKWVFFNNKGHFLTSFDN